MRPYTVQSRLQNIRYFRVNITREKKKKINHWNDNNDIINNNNNSNIILILIIKVRVIITL